MMACVRPSLLFLHSSHYFLKFAIPKGNRRLNESPRDHSQPNTTTTTTQRTTLRVSTSYFSVSSSLVVFLFGYQSLVIMDVLAGPTFTIDVPSSPPPSYAGDSSESSSSIGTPDDSEDENDNVSPQEEEEEVQSKLKGLNSLNSLEESLSIKRGLSNHFVGKSKSFTDLSKVSTVKELEKQENPFNKRRRVLIASKWSRRSSFYSWSNPKSMPLLPVDEDDDYGYDEAEKAKKVTPSSSSSSSPAEEKKPQDQVLNTVPLSYAAHMRLRLGSFKNRRSLSLADLQEHDEEAQDEEEEDKDN
ncbi:uncharacterized protein LOC113847593 [Abrus precatorius]|uniref:Uncharacterized protein LOC113847593 n=1 Tax=Abrus precatorius TaxID=3816 RepID=A0A8B8JMC2_ABRPR|nr:uncharacterized protein LOC113847593 [Abrus precatorius]